VKPTRRPEGAARGHADPENGAPVLLRVEGLRTEISTESGPLYPVDGVTFDVRSGESLGLVGESGGGKSMTVLSVMQLLPPGARIVSGSIRLAGRELTDLDNERMREVRGNDIGMIFQDPMTSLNPTLTIGRQLAEAVMAHRRVGHGDALERAIEVLGLVGMPHPRERINAYPHLLSGGMRQRVMIAMALACDPKILIADEPTTALDVTIQAQILDLIDELRRRLSMALILVTHDLGVVAGRTNRVAVMYAGRTVEIADTDRLFRHPQHPYTRALLDSIPGAAAARKAQLHTIAGSPPELGALPAGCRFAPRCPYATPECTVQDPAMEGPESGHRFACLHPLGSSNGQVGQARLIADAIASPSIGVAKPSSHVILRLEHLEKAFAVTAGAILQRRIGTVSAVADLSLEITEGSTFGLVGESGCGKTTLGRLVVGLETPTSGRILIDGQEPASLNWIEQRRKRRDVQLVFQNAGEALDPRMRIAEILREPLAIQRIGSRKEQWLRVERLLEEVGLSRRHLERLPRELSGGQLQRVGLARALALEPRLVVADEPVSSLDVSVQAQILTLMRELQQGRGLTYILVSHDLSVVRYLSHRVGVMYLGRLVEVGPVEAVYNSPLHPYTRALIDSVPTPDPATERQKAKFRIAGEMPSALRPPSGCRFRTRCPRAQEICSSEVPTLQEQGSVGHAAACHFPLLESVPT
jgi:oligopeptide/dipeptide ABC transporter ATP-binding protein